MNVLRWILLWLILTLGMGAILIGLDFWEWFYDLSRDHESWELDEIVPMLFSGILFAAILGIAHLLEQRAGLQASLNERERLQAEVLALRGREMLGTVTAGLAHSANNLLQPILTLSRLMRDDLPEESEERDDLHRIVVSAEAAKALFDNVLSAGRGPAQMSNACDLTAVLESNRALISASVPSQVSFELLPPLGQEPIWVGLDPTMLLDMILALVTNADHAMTEASGRIIIRLRKSGGRMAGEAILSVVDNGSGMPDEVIERATDPFFTTKPVGEGTGLGLAVVAGQVHKAGGRLLISSRLGQGTEIEIILPLLDPDEEIADGDAP
ncbi:MAG: sensor histidine kinase [Rhodospirillales bacterium]